MKIGKKYIKMRYKKGESSFSATPSIRCHIGVNPGPPGKPPLPREGGKESPPKQWGEILKGSQLNNVRSVKITRRKGDPLCRKTRLQPQRKHGKKSINRRWK